MTSTRAKNLKQQKYVKAEVTVKDLFAHSVGTTQGPAGMASSAQGATAAPTIEGTQEEPVTHAFLESLFMSLKEDL